MPPGKSFISSLLPASRWRRPSISARITGFSFSSGSSRCRTQRLRTSSVGTTTSIGAGEWWIT